MRELGLTKKSESESVVGGAWVQGLRRKEVVGYRRRGASYGPLVFDAATGVLTFAETAGRDGFDDMNFTLVEPSSFLKLRRGM